MGAIDRRTGGRERNRCRLGLFGGRLSYRPRGVRRSQSCDVAVGYSCPQAASVGGSNLLGIASREEAAPEPSCQTVRRLLDSETKKNRGRAAGAANPGGHAAQGVRAPV